MRDQQDLGAIARGVVDANRYLTLGTMNGDGRPWLSPLFFAAKDSTAFYWVSSLAARHSQNLTRHPQVSMVIFDSQVPPYTGQAVYLSARAEQLEGSELDRGLEVFPGPAERGGRAVRLDELQPPSPYRLYRALVSQQWILCPDPAGGASGLCAAHGQAIDHRVVVPM
jgi:hypothetical protein